MKTWYSYSDNQMTTARVASVSDDGRILAFADGTTAARAGDGEGRRWFPTAIEAYRDNASQLRFALDGQCAAMAIHAADISRLAAACRAASLRVDAESAAAAESAAEGPAAGGSTVVVAPDGVVVGPFADIAAAADWLAASGRTSGRICLLTPPGSTKGVS